MRMNQKLILLILRLNKFLIKFFSRFREILFKKLEKHGIISLLENQNGGSTCKRQN